MSGTRAGGRRAAAKNLANDPNFYRRLGAIGGKNGHTGGFATSVDCTCDIIKDSHYVRQCAGKKGGLTSKRVPRAKVWS